MSQKRQMLVIDVEVNDGADPPHLWNWQNLLGVSDVRIMWHGPLYEGDEK